MDSKQRIVAPHDGFLERKWKILMVVTFSALALLGVIAASAAPPSQSSLDAEIAPSHN